MMCLLTEQNIFTLQCPCTMYNLTLYSDNSSDTSGTLWPFKRDKVPTNNAELSISNSESSKYKLALVEEKIENHNNGKVL